MVFLHEIDSERWNLFRIQSLRIKTALVFYTDCIRKKQSWQQTDRQTDHVHHRNMGFFFFITCASKPSYVIEHKVKLARTNVGCLYFSAKVYWLTDKWWLKLIGRLQICNYIEFSWQFYILSGKMICWSDVIQSVVLVAIMTLQNSKEYHVALKRAFSFWEMSFHTIDFLCVCVCSIDEKID